MGATDGETFEGRCLASPFDYGRQSAVVLTNHMPIPVPSQQDEFVREFARDQVGFLSLTGGRTLTLFAARNRMEQVASRVRAYDAQLGERGVRVLVQGELGREETARQFRENPGDVLYGLRSYWQGFDAPGETLSYLVIEKPPYPHPRDLVVAARVRAIADRGGDPFLEYVAPKTAIMMAQGFGRLVRTESDRGVALICDRRLQSPSTANRILLSALPDPTMHYARDRDDAWRFAIRFVTGQEPDVGAAIALAAGHVDLLLERLRIRPGDDPAANLAEAAREVFGIGELRPEQLELMLAHLAGRDAVGVLPTGSGKSLCFQLPALLRAEHRATVVVSPLVALIKDQVDELRSRRGLTAVHGITGTTSGALRTETLRDLAAGRVRLLYVSPERLVRDPVLRKALARQDLAGLVVDEAHCVSAWGHDFRPEYRRVAAAVDDLGRAPRLALTATATTPVRTDVIRTLELVDPVVVQTAADRPNLRLWVQRIASERERARALLRILTAMGEAPGIVYASRRTSTEEVAALLRRAGLSARHYHAGMVPEQRDAVQDDFFAGTTQIVVATKAFGMGVNKADIGWVVHYDLPDSLDSYVQEAGRAARSREMVGECVLLFSEADIARRFGQIEGEAAEVQLDKARAVFALLRGTRQRNGDRVVDPKELAEDAELDEDVVDVALGWLERCGALVQLPDCSASGTVIPGVQEPDDEHDRRRFRELTALLGTRPMVAARVDFDRLEDEHGLDPDDLEERLVSWSLDRVVTFSSSRRYRRVRLKTDHVDAARLISQVVEWRRWQRDQLEAMAGYARDRSCRRARIVAYFGHPRASCRADQQACDVCGGVEPPWAGIPDDRVPDPESLVDVGRVLLQAVAWASSLRQGRYGEVGLKAAVLGQEAVNGRPLGRGLQYCPQFGALRYLRGASRRWDESVAEHIGAGRLVREQVQRESRSYTSLRLTDAGAVMLGGRVG
jgi:ATP-dependent DNA helicase RecQ